MHTAEASAFRVPRLIDHVKAASNHRNHLPENQNPAGKTGGVTHKAYRADPIFNETILTAPLQWRWLSPVTTHQWH